jgi:hypothetical protein
MTEQSSTRESSAMRGLTMRGLAMRTRKLRPILPPVLGLTLCGLALTLASVGAPNPAAARGMGFMGGGMGGGGGMGMGMGHSMGLSMHAPIVPRRGAYIARPPNGTRNPGKGNGNGNRMPPYHPVIGHPIVVPVPGGGGTPRRPRAVWPG